jgi:HEAT repeat protein
MNEENKSRNSEKHDVPGGPYRHSTIIDKESFSAIRIRERVTSKLLSHDSDLKELKDLAFTEEEYEIIRLIAKEGIISGNEPAIRYKAIMAIGNLLSPQNLNTLADLALFNEDFYVRGHAMLALGKTGLFSNLPIIIKGLKSKERFEQVAATRALLRIINETSLSAVRSHLLAIHDTTLAKEVDKVIEQAKSDQRRSPPSQKTKSKSERNE